MRRCIAQIAFRLLWVLGVLASKSFSCEHFSVSAAEGTQGQCLTQGPQPVNVWCTYNVLAFSSQHGTTSKGILALHHSKDVEGIVRMALHPDSYPCPVHFQPPFFIGVDPTGNSLINIYLQANLQLRAASWETRPGAEDNKIFMKCKSDHIIFLLKVSLG